MLSFNDTSRGIEKKKLYSGSLLTMQAGRNVTDPSTNGNILP